jgi:DNA-binding NtrC family response regulator
MDASGKVLIVDDDSGFLKLVVAALSTNGYETFTAQNEADARAIAEKESIDLVVTDYKLHNSNGIDLIRVFRQAYPHCPIILTTGYGSDEVAIQAIKEGAYDYLLKPFTLPELFEMVHNAIETSHARSETAKPNKPSLSQSIIGHSRAIQNVFKEIGRVANKKVTVLIRGESGTGKELVASAIHQYSERAVRPLVTVNCVAIPETLLESELFGHERGSFTGAHARKIGRFEQANGGTIFLDEIGDMSLSTQAKLLRVLQEGCIQRIGGQEDVKIDVRIIAATNRDLELAIEKKLFRQDLFYRLSVVDIHLPALRERIEDIPELINHFVAKHSKELGYQASPITRDAMTLLQQHSWPGNIRELENLIRKAIIYAREQPITPAILANLFLKPTKPDSENSQNLPDMIAALLTRAAAGEIASVRDIIDDLVERELYKQAITLARGNQRKAAGWLGVSRPTMKEKLVKYELYDKAEKESD